MEEHWVPIQEHVFFAVSDQGRVKRREYRAVLEDGTSKICPEEILPQRINGVYKYVNVDGEPLFVHKLVAAAFCERRADQDRIYHKDQNKHNNAASNLVWSSTGEYFKFKQSLGPVHLPQYTGKKVICVDTDEVFSSIRDCAKTISCKPDRLVSHIKKQTRLQGRLYRFATNSESSVVNQV